MQTTYIIYAAIAVLVIVLAIWLIKYKKVLNKTQMLALMKLAETKAADPNVELLVTEKMEFVINAIKTKLPAPVIMLLQSALGVDWAEKVCQKFYDKLESELHEYRIENDKELTTPDGE